MKLRYGLLLMFRNIN
jgi:hypothetical protein